MLPSRLRRCSRACTEQQFATRTPPAVRKRRSSVPPPRPHAAARRAAQRSRDPRLTRRSGLPRPRVPAAGRRRARRTLGNTDIKKKPAGRARSPTPNSKPSPTPPISSFETSLPSGPHSILTGYGNLCEESLAAPTTIVAQNGLRDGPEHADQRGRVRGRAEADDRQDAGEGREGARDGEGLRGRRHGRRLRQPPSRNAEEEHGGGAGQPTLALQHPARR